MAGVGMLSCDFVDTFMVFVWPCVWSSSVIFMLFYVILCLFRAMLMLFSYCVLFRVSYYFMLFYVICWVLFFLFYVDFSITFSNPLFRGSSSKCGRFPRTEDEKIRAT